MGITVTTVVFNRVARRNGPGVDNIASYRAAQWTSFAFGILGNPLFSLFPFMTDTSPFENRNAAVHSIFYRRRRGWVPEAAS